MSKKKEAAIVDQPYRIFIVGGNYDYIRMLYNMGYRGAPSLEECDIVLFTGGEDVDPRLYGEEPLRRTFFNKQRDEYEMAIFNKAVEMGKPMVGICRGGQFLNVANKGKMWQDVNGHAGNHQMFIVDAKGKTMKTIDVTSTHHQMMIPSDEGEVLAVAEKSTEFLGFGQEKSIPKPKRQDVEVVWYGKTGCLCFQPHPEFKDAPSECTKYFESLLENLVVPTVWQFNPAN